MRIGSWLFLLISVTSFDTFSESLKHEFKEGVIKAQLIKSIGYSSIIKDKNSFKYSVVDNDDNLKFVFILPWKPTHRSVTNGSAKTLIGSLKRNGHNGVGELLIFDENGLVKSFTHVVHFDAVSDDGNFYIIKDKNNKHELTVYDTNLKSIGSKSFTEGFDNHSLLSISPSGDRISLSAASPDMSSRKTAKVYFGSDYEKHLEWHFDGLPIYQVNQLKQGITTLNVNHKLIAFKGPEKVWEFPNHGRRFLVNAVEASQNGKYLFIQDRRDTTNFVVLNFKGKVIIDSESLKGEFNYLKEHSRFYFALKNDALIIRNNQLNLLDVYSLNTGKRVKKLRLTKEDIVDSNDEFLLTTQNGQLRKSSIK